MKIKKITQAPFGTILSLDHALEENSVGNFLTVNNQELHKVLGTSSEKWTEVLVPKTEALSEGQEISILRMA